MDTLRGTHLHLYRKGFHDKTLIRTVMLVHFENGECNTGGDYVRARPFQRGERDRDTVVAEFHAVQGDTNEPHTFPSRHQAGGARSCLCARGLLIFFPAPGVHLIFAQREGVTRMASGLMMVVFRVHAG